MDGTEVTRNFKEFQHWKSMVGSSGQNEGIMIISNMMSNDWFQKQKQVNQGEFSYILLKLTKCKLEADI